MKKLMIFLLSTLVALTGCDTTKRKNFVVLIDNSTSVSEQVFLSYIKTIQETILPNMSDKDKLTLLFIDKCSQDKAERIFSFNLAEMDFTNKADGVNKKEDSCRARLRRYLTVTVKKDIESVILAKREERKDCGSFTDIINALEEAGKLVDNKKNYSNETDKIMNDAQGDDNFEYETCFILFSDMVNENKEKTFDFTTFGKMTAEEVNKKVQEVKDMNKIPDLHGVKIVVYGATSTKEAGNCAGKQIENVKLFWDQFFKAAGAEVKGYGFDCKKEINDYMCDANN